MIKAIVFDCFGVLVGKGFEQTYRLAGGDPNVDREFIDDILGQANLGFISNNEFGNIMAKKVGITPEAWEEVLREAEQLDTELLEYIVNLRASYKTAILSNANTQVLDSRIGQAWLKKAFDDVIVSAEVGLVKPDPRVYQLVADRLGVDINECVYIDDRHSFVVTANELGMKSLVYSSFLQFKEDISRILS
jgi:epoxide hydrolase-like predicted phosphatase